MSEISSTLRQDLSALVRLALPITFVQVGMMLMGVVDTMMVGRVSETALAAVAVGNLVFFGAIAYGLGSIMGLDPILAQAHGARDHAAMARGLQRGILLAVGLTLPTTLVLAGSEPLLRFARQPEEVIPLAARYAWISIPGVLPFYVFLVLRQTLQVVGSLRMIVMVILLANLANVGLNWLMVFGHGGFPAWGALGSAWASTISRWILALSLLACSWRHLRSLLFPWHRECFARAGFMRLLRLGMPVGIQLLLEFGAFAVIALLMGWLGSREIAAHQIAINLASLTFMMPLGISGAASVLVGRAIGAGQMQAARRYAALSLASAAAVMACASAVLLGFPQPLAQLYTNQIDVITIAILLIPMAGIFQVFDGLQVVASGVLRGAADTRGPMVINVLGFWLAGMPTAVYLAFVAHVGPVGLWWGLVVGLATVAMLLLLRVIRLLQNPISRVQIDLPPAYSGDPSSQTSLPEVVVACAGDPDAETVA